MPGTNWLAHTNSAGSFTTIPRKGKVHMQQSPGDFRVFKEGTYECRGEVFSQSRLPTLESRSKHPAQAPSHMRTSHRLRKVHLGEGAPRGMAEVVLPQVPDRSIGEAEQLFAGACSSDPALCVQTVCTKVYAALRTHISATARQSRCGKLGWPGLQSKCFEVASAKPAASLQAQMRYGMEEQRGCPGPCTFCGTVCYQARGRDTGASWPRGLDGEWCVCETDCCTRSCCVLEGEGGGSAAGCSATALGAWVPTRQKCLGTRPGCAATSRKRRCPD